MQLEAAKGEVRPLPFNFVISCCPGLRFFLRSVHERALEALFCSCHVAWCLWHCLARPRTATSWPMIAFGIPKGPLHLCCSV